MDKRTAAKELYMAGETHVGIASKLNVTTRTVENWAAAGKWSEKRVSVDILGETREEQILEIIDYNLSVLRDKVAKHRAEGASKLIEKDEIESLVRLYSTVRGGQSKLNEAVKLMRRALEHIQNIDLAAAKVAAPAFDLLINELAREL